MNSTLINASSGIRTHQFGLDSLANNIANVNTTGYRENVPQFESLFAAPMETLNSTSPVSNDFNYGTTKASNAISTRSGSYKNTDGDFDVAYSGKGWLVVGENKNGEFTITNDGYESKQKTYFTRDGGFMRDGEGYIVNARGYYMYGVNLGKIENEIFTTSQGSDEDFVKLGAGTLTPIQIPQNLYFRPVVTTKVDLALNINKSAHSVNVTKVYMDSDEKFDEEAFMNADINSLSIEGDPLNASVYDTIKISIKINGRNEDYVFAYGKDFRSFKELQEALLQKSGLGIDIERLPDGSVGPKVAMKVFNATFSTRSVTISGSLADKLHISGRNDNFKSGIDREYSPNKMYQSGDILNLNGVAVRYIGEEGNSNPFEDSANWEVMDTSALGEWKQNTSYKVDEMVNYEGRVYRKIESSGNSRPNEGGWEEVAQSTMNLPQTYEEGREYNPKDVVLYQGDLFQKLTQGSAGNPRADSVGWRVLHQDIFESAYLETPTYQTNVEIFDEGGRKFLLQSHYYLLSSLDKESQDPKNEIWEVRTRIFDKDGIIPLGEQITHKLEFDEAGNAIAEPISVPFDSGEIAYNIANTQNLKTTNRPYQESSILQTEQDGKNDGHLANLRIDKDGLIFLSFTNGVTEVMGRVGISAFVNDQGLKKVGNNLFEMTEITNGEDAHIASGKPLLGWDGQNLRFGTVMYKKLETSNVNVGEALTDLIVMQRGYSMNARAFTTGDELIKEALNLKR